MPDAAPDNELGTRPATPRWVKAIGVVLALVLLIALAVMVLGGGQHGPWQHAAAIGMPAASF